MEFRADNLGEELQRQTLPHLLFAYVGQSIYEYYFPPPFGPRALVPSST